MSTPFYDLASLVVVPSGYKSGKVYAQKPLTTDGQLTFTRASSATRVASNGLIEKVRTNALTYSQTFSDASWLIGTGLTKTQGQTDPNGGTTAVLISNVSEANGYMSKAVTLNANVPHTFSIYIKGSSSGSVSLRLDDSTTGPQFDINYTTSWQRFSVTRTPDQTGCSFVVGGYSTWAIGENIQFAFAQGETGDIATPYIATTTAAVSVGPVSGLPRLDYLNSTCPKLLLESQRTNLVTFSEQINNAAWTQGNSPTITTNIATAPDGTIGADGIQSADAATYKTITQSVSVSANGTLTLSFFVKKETSETFFGGFTMYFQGGTDKIVYGIVNAVTGTVTYASSTLTATTKVESYGNYWRIASTATDNGSNTSCGIGYYGTLSTNGTVLNTGAGSVRTIWGFQAEAGAYATSYIPTLAASVTRVADAASKTGISSLIGQTEGVIFVDFNFENKPDTSGNVAILLRGSSSEAYIYLSGLNLQADFISGGIQCSIVGLIGAVGRKKIAFAYKQNDFALYMNGVQIGTDSSGTVGSLTALTVGSYDSTGYLLNSGINQALLFKTRLTNAQLAELTAL